MTDLVHIDRQVAENDFNRWAEAWDIDTDREYMDAEDREDFDNMRTRMIRAIQRGRLVISETADEVTQSLHRPLGETAEVTYRIPSGSAWLTMDQHKEKQGMHKMFSYLGSMTGLPYKTFSNMDGRDLKLAQQVAALFMA